MGSRNKNTGENRSKRMANELNVAGSQVARGTSLHGTNEAFDKALRDEVKKGRKVAGTNIRHGFNALKNIDPNRLSDFRGGTKYSGDTAGTVNAQELREIGLERDKLANQRTYAGDQLGALESGNRFLGLNPTSGMGIMQSLKRNFTNPEAQRSYANTRNIGRTLANMGPIGGILRGLSNSLFGTDLQPMQMEGMPMGNIDPRVAGFFGAAQGAPNTAFGYTESPLNMETYSPDYIADRLFNTYTAPAADPIRQPVFTGEQTTMTPMKRPDQPAPLDTWQFSDRYGGDPNDPFGGGPIALAPQYQSELMGLVGPGTPGFMSSGEVTLGKGSAAEQMGLANTQDLDGNGIVDNLDSAIAANAYAQNQLPGSALFTTDIDSDQMKENIKAHTQRMNALNQPSVGSGNLPASAMGVFSDMTNQGGLDLVQQNQAMGLNGFTGYY